MPRAVTVPTSWWSTLPAWTPRSAAVQSNEAPTANGPAQVTPDAGPPSGEKSQLRSVTVPLATTASETVTSARGSAPVLVTW